MQIRSFSNKNVYYEVDENKKTCSCPKFAKEGHCKHLDVIGIYAVKEWYPKTHPSFSQALSALIKSLRLRRLEDAVYWVAYLHGNDEKGSRFRLARRLFLATVEDGMSVAVMKRTSSNFGMLCKQDTPLIKYVAECIRVCEVPNWWHPSTNGHDYIYTGMTSKRRHLYEGVGSEFILPMDENNLWAKIEQGVKEKDVTSMAYAWAAMEAKGADYTEIAKWVQAIAVKEKNKVSYDLATLHTTHERSMRGDNNFIAQALWTMLAGDSPVCDEIHNITSDDAKPLIEQAAERWKNPDVIPSWAVDGVHCAGSDRRFCGAWQDMYAACNAYKFYDRLDPADGWKREFFCLDNLPLVETSK